MDQENPESNSNLSSESVVYAAASQTLGDPTDSIVFLPKGEWKINPSVNGKSDSVEVMVDEDTAKVLQESLETRLKDTIRPHASFDHRPGPASFLPKAFKWDDERGVMLDVDWTKSGQEAITGRDYSYFSPTFLLRDKKVIGLPKDGEIGSLTNNPAFRKIQRIAASADVEPRKDMSKISEKLVELKVISAQQAESGDEDFVVRAIDGLHGELVLAHKANELLKTENTDLKLRVQATQEAEAAQLIEAAIMGGSFPAKDVETIQFFKEQYLAHPEQTKKVLQALSGNAGLFKREVDIKVGGREKGAVNGPELISAQQKLIREIIETNPGMSNHTAFNKARDQRPELFVEA